MKKPSLKKEVTIPDEIVMNKIFIIREKKVMLDRDLAELFGVPTKVFNQAVTRNSKRFPEDFMFRLSKEEFKNLRSRIVTSSWGGVRYNPRAFTEQGVAMLASVLNSDQAINVNIQIIRVFTRMREMLLSNKDLLLKIEQFEKRIDHHDKSIKQLFDYLKQLVREKNPPRNQIGFKTNC